jgi:NAD(P)-dependent dehydrogenase (short-subunit alcohol dehydrogenase family)
MTSSGRSRKSTCGLNRPVLCWGASSTVLVLGQPQKWADRVLSAGLWQTLTAALRSKQIVGPDGETHSLDVWNFAIGVNLTGTFNLTRIACKYLVDVPPEGPDGERGVVVMVASAAAVRSRTSRSCAACVL